MYNEQLEGVIVRLTDMMERMMEQQMESQKTYVTLLARSEERMENINRMIGNLITSENSFVNLCTDIKNIYKEHIEGVAKSRDRAEEVSLHLSKLLDDCRRDRAELSERFISALNKPSVNMRQS